MDEECVMCRLGPSGVNESYTHLVMKDPATSERKYVPICLDHFEIWQEFVEVSPSE